MVNPNLRARSAAAVQQRSIFPLKPDYKATEVRTIKHSKYADATSKDKITSEVMVIDDDATNYQLLTAVHQFQTAANRHAWPVTELCAKFEAQLDGEFLTTWTNETMATVTTTSAEFRAVQDRFLSEYFEPDDAEVQIEYLRSIRKPRDIDPKRFSRLLKHQKVMIKEMPNGASFVPSDRELKRMFYKAMPNQWRLEFDKAGKDLNSMSMEKLVNYFEIHSRNDPFVERKSSERDNQGGNPGGRSSQSRTHSSEIKGPRGGYVDLVQNVCFPT